MKFSAILIASLASAAYGFAPSMQSSRFSPLFMADTASRPVTTPATNIDKSLDGIDGDSSAFDPTEGDHPALTRNNNDEVWVSQVRSWRVAFSELILSLIPNVVFLTNCILVVYCATRNNNRELAPVVTVNHQPCEPWSVSPL